MQIKKEKSRLVGIFNFEDPLLNKGEYFNKLISIKKVYVESLDYGLGTI